MTYDDGLTPDVLENIVHRAIADKDFHGVVAALKVLAVRDPERAKVLYDVIQLGLTMAERRYAREATS